VERQAEDLSRWCAPGTTMSKTNPPTEA